MNLNNMHYWYTNWNVIYVFFYEYFDSKEDAKLPLCHINLLTGSSIKEYKEYFSEISFHKTLKNLICCGEYNKTKK